MATEDIPPIFKGDLIDYVKLHGGIKWLYHEDQAYIPVRPICEILGLSWSAQHRKLTGRNATVLTHKIRTRGADGRSHEMFCISYPDFLWWLLSIHPKRIRREAREAVDMMRRDVKTVLQNEAKKFFSSRIGRM